MRHRVRTISQILPKRKKKDVFNPFDTALPPVVATSIAFIEQNGLYLEGIFRYSSEIKKVKFYLQKFEQGKMKEWEAGTDPHLVASVLKAWLCDLESPLLTTELHDSFIAAQNSTTHESTIRRLATVISLLPPGNKKIFQMLTRMFVKLDVCQEENKMSSSNLAIIFSPMLLRSNGNLNLAQMLEQSEAANRVLVLCITHYVEIFEDQSGSTSAANLHKTASSRGFRSQITKGGMLLAKKFESELNGSNFDDPIADEDSISYSTDSYVKSEASTTRRDIQLSVNYKPKKKMRRKRPKSKDFSKRRATVAFSGSFSSTESPTGSVIDDKNKSSKDESPMRMVATREKRKSEGGITDNDIVSLQKHLLKRSQKIDDQLVELENFSMENVLDEENKILLSKYLSTDFAPTDPLFSSTFCEEEEEKLRQLEREENEMLKSVKTIDESSIYQSISQFEDVSMIEDVDVMDKFEQEAMLQLEQMQAQQEEEEYENNTLNAIKKSNKKRLKLEEKLARDHNSSHDFEGTLIEESSTASMNGSLSTIASANEEIAAPTSSPSSETAVAPLLSLKAPLVSVSSVTILEQDFLEDSGSEEDVEESDEDDDDVEKVYSLDSNLIFSSKRRELEEKYKKLKEKHGLLQSRPSSKIMEASIVPEPSPVPPNFPITPSIPRAVPESTVESVAELQAPVPSSQVPPQADRQEIEEVTTSFTFESEPEKVTADHQANLSISTSIEITLHDILTTSAETTAPITDLVQEEVAQPIQEEKEAFPRLPEANTASDSTLSPPSPAAEAEAPTIADVEDKEESKKEEKGIKASSTGTVPTLVKTMEALIAIQSSSVLPVSLVHSGDGGTAQNQLVTQAKKDKPTTSTPIVEEFTNPAVIPEAESKTEREEREAAVEEEEEGQIQDEEEEGKPPPPKPSKPPKVRVELATEPPGKATEHQAKVQQFIEMRRQSLLMQKQKIEEELQRYQKAKKITEDVLQTPSSKATIDIDVSDATHTQEVKQRKMEEETRFKFIEEKRKEVEIQKQEVEKKRAKKRKEKKPNIDLVSPRAPAEGNEPFSLLHPRPISLIPRLYSPTEREQPLSPKILSAAEKRNYVLTLLSSIDCSTITHLPDIEDNQVPTETISYPDGSKYIGTLQNGLWHGRGRIIFPDGNVYDGETRNGAIHGVGLFLYANGDKYIGEWVNAQRHGWGRYIAVSGVTYEGEFKNDLRYGKGTYTSHNGDTYRGEFVNDKYHGSGSYETTAGSKYVGSYADGLKDGYGKYTLVNGDVYEGYFKNNKFNGEGVYTYASGEKISGFFKDGMPV